jgi:predicted anti-sigma-YlaC factor YlaD
MREVGRDINCPRVVEVMTDYLETALAAEDARVVDRHLETCEGCRRYLVRMGVTIGTLERLREEDVPDEMRGRLLAAFRELTQR